MALFIILICSLIFPNVEIEHIQVFSHFVSFDPNDHLDKNGDPDINQSISSIGRGSHSLNSKWINVEKGYNSPDYSVQLFNVEDPENSIEFKKNSVKRKKKYNANNVIWSKVDEQKFYFSHLNKKNKWIFEYAELDALENTFDIVSIFPTNQDKKYLDDIEINYVHLADYAEEGEYYYAIVNSFMNGQASSLIITDYDVPGKDYKVNSIFNSFDDEFNRSLYSKIESDDYLLDAREIDTKYDKSNMYLQSVINFRSQKSYQEYDIYYFCDLNDETTFFEDAGYQIFPRIEEFTEEGTYYPYCKQFEAKFNHNGSKVAFLSQPRIDSEDICPTDGKNIDLWIFDLKDYFQMVCIENPENSNLDYEESYFKVDEKIRNTFGMDEGILSLARDYVWHPDRDIIFYINEDKNNAGEITYPISYYNFEDCDNNNISSCDKGILETFTENNKQLSISKDGNYLTFSFSKTKKNNPKVKGKCYNCENFYKDKVASAKIVINE